MTRTVDLEALGATMGSFGPPPYAGGDTMYHQAYNNKLVLQGAIDQAYADGVTELKFESGVLNLTYELYSNSNAAGHGEKLIILKSNTIYDFAGLKIEMMFDSDYKSPYHTSTSKPEPWELHGRVFYLDVAYNITIKNLNLQGEMYYRSWSNPQEKWQEQSGGIMAGKIGGNYIIENCEIYAFTGGCIQGGGVQSGTGLLNTEVNGDNKFRYFKPGYYDPITDTVDVSITTAYHSEWRGINRIKYDAENKYLKNFVEFGRVAGPNYYFKYNSLTFQVLFGDENMKTISYGTYEWMDLVYLPPNAAYVQIQLLEEPVHELTPEGYWDTESLWYAWTMRIPAVRDVEVFNCKFYDAHRGAITNMPSNTHFHHNRLWCNGLDSGVGAPLFPDTTRYHWNNEEAYNSGFHIHDNEFTDGFNGVMFVSNDVLIERNKFFNTGGVYFTKGNRFTIRDNEFKSGNGAYPSGSISIGKVPGDFGQFERTVLIEGNRFLDVRPFSIHSAFANKLTKVTIQNNYVRGAERIDLGGNKNLPNNLIVDGNTFILVDTGVSGYATMNFISLTNFNNNIIETVSGAAASNTKLRPFFWDVEGVNNKVIGALWHPYRSTFNYPETNNIKGFEFINCNIGHRTLSTNQTLYTLNFKDCKFTNTQVKLAKGPIDNEWTVNANFENTTFEAFGDVINTAFIYSNYFSEYFENSMYNLSFKDCKVIDNNTNTLKLFRAASPVKDANIKIINTEYEGVGKLTDHIAISKKL